MLCKLRKTIKKNTEMKRIHIFTVLVLSFLMLSFVNKPEDEVNKPIKPVSEKINGPMGAYFQVVQKEYLAQDGLITIEFKRIKDGWPAVMKTNAQLGDCDECYEIGFMAEFMDQNGNVLRKSLADYISSYSQLAGLRSLKLSETGSVTFMLEPSSASRVKMLSDFVYHGTATSDMKGNVNGTMDILMSLEFTPQGEAKGGYYHQKFGPNALLCLTGKLDGQDLVLDEYSSEGKRVGRFKGVFKDGRYEGIYQTFNDKTYGFSLLEDPALYPVDYSMIDFNDLSQEPAYEADRQSDYEQFFQELFEKQGVLISVKDTMQLVLNKTALELVEGESDTLVLAALSQSMPVSWTSTDESVAMVGSMGVVRAIGPGEAFIVASVCPTKRDTVSTRAFIKVNALVKEGKTATTKGKTQPKSSTIDLKFATYEPLPQDGMSGVKNGQPHGNGIMRFKSSHIIPGTQDCVAEPGEWVSGMWRDGKINVGTWYRNDGNQVIVKLGQRYNK